MIDLAYIFRSLPNPWPALKFEGLERWAAWKLAASRAPKKYRAGYGNNTHPLCGAAEAGDAKEVRRLLGLEGGNFARLRKTRAKWMYGGSIGHGALVCAARAGSFEAVVELLRFGVGRSKHYRLWTLAALRSGAARDSVPIVSALIGLAGEDLDGGEGGPLLMSAIQYGGSAPPWDCGTDALGLLLGFCDPKKLDKDGWSCLSRAAVNGNAGAVEMLLPVSDPGSRGIFGRTALMCAANGPNPRCVELLLPASNPDEGDETGMTALMIAAKWGHLESVAILAPVSDLRAVCHAGKDARAHAVIKREEVVEEIEKWMGGASV